MRFSTIFTVLAAGAMAFAGAVPEIVAKRSVADVRNAFSDLSDKCDTIIPKFDDCYDNTCSEAIVVELVTAIDVCTDVLDGLTGIFIGTPALATVVVDVVTKITIALNKHKTKCGSGCTDLINIYADVDLSLSLCLKVAFKMCLGLALLVSTLLISLVAILKGLIFTLILKACLLI